MIRKHINRQIYSQLPAYINDTLGPVQRKIVGYWLKRDAQAQTTADNLQTLQKAVLRQPRRSPSPAVLGQIQSQIYNHQAAQSIAAIRPGRIQQQALSFPVLLLSVVSLLLAATVLWQTIPPGIVLQWSVEGQTPETFLVYRTLADSSQVISDNQFELLDEVPATRQLGEYTFTDVLLLPGQNYIYRVEGLTAAGQPAASQMITGRAIDALPGQLAMLLILVFCGYVIYVMVQQLRPMTVATI